MSSLFFLVLKDLVLCNCCKRCFSLNVPNPFLEIVELLTTKSSAILHKKGENEDDENSTGFWFSLSTNVSLGVYMLLIFSIVCIMYMKRVEKGTWSSASILIFSLHSCHTRIEMDYL